MSIYHAKVNDVRGLTTCSSYRGIELRIFRLHASGISLEMQRNLKVPSVLKTDYLACALDLGLLYLTYDSP